MVTGVVGVLVIPLSFLFSVFFEDYQTQKPITSFRNAASNGDIDKAMHSFVKDTSRSIVGELIHNEKSLFTSGRTEMSTVFQDNKLRATVYGTVTHYATAKQTSFTAIVVKEGADWRIQDFRVLSR